MRIGTIGAGSLGQAVAGQALKAGHEVVLSNSRGPESLAGVVEELGPGASAGTVEEAADADLVLLAVPWSAVEESVAGLPRKDGRIVIDATNQFGPGMVVENSGVRTGSEWVQSLIPGSRVIKAFNAMYASFIAADPAHDEGRQVVFYAGDDLEAKRVFDETVSGFGFAPVDLGPLREGGRLTQVDGGPLSGLHLLRQS